MPDPAQSSLTLSLTQPIRDTTSRPVPSLSQQIQALDEYVDRYKRMRRKRKRALTNCDPVWNKRLKNTHKTIHMDKNRKV